jgi:hypothetical protein
MKRMSAAAGVRDGIVTVAAVRTLPLSPGAPGCTMGAWPHAVAAALNKLRAAYGSKTRNAMSNYTTRGFAGSNYWPLRLGFRWRLRTPIKRSALPLNTKVAGSGADTDARDTAVDKSEVPVS